MWGYKLINLIGCIVEGKNYQLVPIGSELHSETEAETRCLKTINLIIETTLLTNNKCIYVMDRAYDSRQFLEFLSYINENQYVIRSCGKRNLRLVGEKQEKPFLEVCKEIDLRHKIKTTDKDVFLCGVKQVEIRIDQTPRKDAVYQKTNLVVCRYKNPPKGNNSNESEKGGFFYLLCNFHDKNMSDKEIITKALTTYKLRWKIEETHRQVKQDFNWDEMRLQKLQSLKNLNLMLWIVICFLYDLDHYKEELSYVYTKQMTRRTSDVKTNWLRFIYYRLKRVLDYVFRYFSKYRKIQHKKKTLNEQLTLAF